jgi:hypothetical protein
MSNRQSFLAAQFLESVDEAISDIKKNLMGTPSSWNCCCRLCGVVANSLRGWNNSYPINAVPREERNYIHPICEAAYVSVQKVTKCVGYEKRSSTRVSQVSFRM